MEPHRIDNSLQYPCFGIIGGSKVSPIGAKHTVKKQRCQQRARQRILLCQCVDQIFRHIAEQLIGVDLLLRIGVFRWRGEVHRNGRQILSDLTIRVKAQLRKEDELIRNRCLF